MLRPRVCANAKAVADEETEERLQHENDAETMQLLEGEGVQD
jgi:hypothetical protein